MEAKTRNQGESYVIEVETEQKVALVVKSSSGERIYLPGEKGSDSTYYNDDTTFLQKGTGGWAVKHPEEPEEVLVIS
jgi:hypothetical protein